MIVIYIVIYKFIGRPFEDVSEFENVTLLALYIQFRSKSCLQTGYKKSLSLTDTTKCLENHNKNLNLL